MMTVKALVALLAQMPQDAQVVVDDPEQLEAFLYPYNVAQSHDGDVVIFAQLGSYDKEAS